VSALPTTPARDAALAATERRPCTVLEITLDKCANTYGSAPCTASGAAGSACYNTYTTCQDKAHYVKSSQTIRFVSRGVQSPPGEALRPYLVSADQAATTLDFEAGLATRNATSVTLADEPDNDSEMDPYYATRPAPPGGTFFARLLARNKNYAGRPALLRRGFVASPWDWSLFLDERYIIDTIAVDGAGHVKFTLKDPLKLADANKLPAPTDGALVTELKGFANIGVVVAATATTVTLASDANPTDGYYTGMEVYIYSGVGSGQRRVITGYVGATRVATVAAWSVVPTTASSYQVSALQLTLTAGKGAQYADPATSGKNEYVRIGKEIIRYTAKSGDVLSWPDATYRAQFGSTREDHAVGSTVQLCRAFIDQPVGDVLTALLTESGIDAGYLSPDIATESANYYGAGWNITTCLSAPEKASTLIGDLLKQIGAVMWWSPQTHRVEMKAIMPRLVSPPVWSDESNLIKGGTSVKSLDALRITQAMVNYALIDATANLSEPRNYQRAEVHVDAAAQSAVEYNDTRPSIINSRWFGTSNSAAMRAVVSRLVNRMRDAPLQFSVKIDPKDYTLSVGEMVEIKTFKHTDAAGQPLAEKCFIVQSVDRGTHIEVQARSANFAARSAFIAPDGTADFPTEKVHAHVASASGLMPDGSAGYSIL